MKHAYLIIAHNEFGILQRLIDALDDLRNDIYVLIDKKVRILPKLSSIYSELFILDDAQRVAVYWGHVSQIKAEFALFNNAFKNGPYEYYHVISGVHLPLKSQNYIHSFFKQHVGKQILQPMKNDDYQTNYKIRHKHFFLKYFKHRNRLVQRMAQILWRRCIRMQSNLKRNVNSGGQYIKAANWVSLTNSCVKYLIQNESSILKKYARTFCGDEFFVPSELASSPFKDQCYFYPFLIYSAIQKDTSAIIKKEDCKKLLQTDFLFARKFSEKNMDSVNEVLQHIKKVS